MDSQEKLTLQNVSNALVEQPIELEVDVKPLNSIHEKLQRWKVLRAKKKLILRPITMGNLIRISKILLEIDMNLYDVQQLLESNYKAISMHGYDLAKIVAIAIQNNRSEPDHRKVSFILDNFTSKEMLGVLAIIVKQMDLTSFMSSIISVKGMNILESKTAVAETAKLPEVSPLNQGS